MSPHQNRSPLTSPSGDGRDANGAYQKLIHRWGDPLPGQGNVPVCLICGTRHSVAIAAAECPGKGSGLPVAHHTDYDPFP